MKVIRLQVFQEKASYRVAYSFENIETYPLPPYSTVLGFLHNILQAKETINGINLSIQGRYEGLVKNYIRFHKFESKKNKGKPYPIVVAELFNVELIIHIRMPSEKLHMDLLNSLKNPPLYPYLGRPEDLIVEMQAEEVEDIQKEIEDLPYNAYIPKGLADKLNLELDGILYNIDTYYNKVNSIRVFKKIPVLYVQEQYTVAEKVNHDGSYPIWWMSY
jgi:CRISPR-associated protein Cas5t